MQTELLAPAGDLEAAYSAFYFGADAVYLGLRQFSARAEATNFSPADLDEITAYAHAHGKKVYVTVNTVVQEAELPSLMETLATCVACHADAVIVQDWGVARLIRTTFPELAMHASTQMAIHNLAGALTMKKMGFSRVVPARELMLTEIREIQQKSGLEVEVFIHGALCYSYSGLCLFSSMETGRSANRGKCVYSCRGLFQMNGRQYHPFSMKDLALEKDATKLRGLSLKIEGRKKNALYVGAVVDYYRRILDTGRVDSGLTDNLKQIFARPWTKLHLNGKNKDVIEPDFVGHRGLPIGQVEKVLHQTITCRITHRIERYDGISDRDVAGQEKPFGFSAEQMTVGGKKVYEASAGQTVTLTLPPHHPFIQKGNAIYLASSTRVKGAYRYEKPKPGLYKNRHSIDVDVFIETNQISACSGEKTACTSGSFSPARSPEKVVEGIRSAFEKTGDTPWQLGSLTVHNPKGLFVPVSVLNGLRRDLYSQLTIQQPVYTLPETRHLKKQKSKPKWIIRTDDMALAKALPDCDELIYVLSPDDKPEDLSGLNCDRLRLALPTILRPEARWYGIIDSFIRAGYQCWEVGNPAGLSLLPTIKDMTLDCSVTMMNTQAIEEALSLGMRRITFSPEDTQDNITTLSEKTTQTALVLYQDVPLFLSANCIRENGCDMCSRQPMETDLTSGRNHYRVISRDCQTVVTDTRPLVLPASAQTIPVEAYRIDFCWRHYTPEQAVQIIEQIKKQQKIRNATTGNFEKQFAK